MTDYRPDSWVVLKVKAGKGAFPFYKVLAGWSGGYMDDAWHYATWRINSGITEVRLDGDYYEFHGESGSLYICHKEAYGLSMTTAAVYKDLYLQQEFGGLLVMPQDTDWSKLV